MEYVTVTTYQEKTTKVVGAHVVKKKGFGSGIAESIIKHVEQSGCKGTIIVSTDQEPTLQTVTEDMRRLVTRRSLRRRRSTIHTSTKLQSRRSRQLEGQVRAMMLAQERRLHAKILVNHNINTWLVEHAADILNKFVVGADGRTAYEGI